VRKLAIAALGLTLSSNAFASDCEMTASIDFVESAPRDHVSIRHDSPTGWNMHSFSWELQGSKGDLIFDTVVGGPGYEVAQPFEGSGTGRLAAAPTLADGDRQLSLSFQEFPSTASYRFTLDVDDRVSGRGGTMISGSEISGSGLSVIMTSPDGEEFKMTGSFDESATAVLRGNCVR